MEYSFRYLYAARNKLVKYPNRKNYKCLKIAIKGMNNIYYFISDEIEIKIKKLVISYDKLLIRSLNSSFHNEIFFLKVYGFKNVVLSSEGSIHYRYWNLTTEGGCKCYSIPKLSLQSHYHQYDKVISITHHWGNAIFHSIVECLTKIGYYIPELLKDKSTKIHIHKSASVNYLHFLGFNNSRIIYGNIHVKRLLVLEKGGCGSPPPLIHLYYFRYYARKKITSKPMYDIILIKRYGIREIINFDNIFNLVQKKYKSVSLAIFYPNTSFLNTLNYFKYAKLIIAPHGAGLSHIILSKKCAIIEFILNNLCYSSLASSLGLNYFGIKEIIKNGKFDVNITNVKTILNVIKIK